jgi:DNA polymerase-3 subunit alpha
LNREKEVLGLYLSSHPLDDYKYEMRHCTDINLVDLADLTDSKGREVVFAGVITACRNAISKKGKEYSVVNLEDYAGGYELFLMGEDALRYRHLFEEDRVIYVKARVETKQYQSRGSNGEPVLSEPKVRTEVTGMGLLGDILKDQFQSLHLFFDLAEVNPQRVDELLELVKKHEAGDGTGLELCIFVVEESRKLGSRSQTKKALTLSKELLMELDDKGWRYDLGS